ncbi:hypothetical protein EV359DRAFT_66091 [Lentinula novae-zelandiae]|nr:hypothetical protein EV359DRAFT_66091 [Lentinula novae-zelandiae]
MLQETRMQPSSTVRSPTGFTAHALNRRRSADNIENPWGGVATLVRDGLESRVNGIVLFNTYIIPESSRTDWTQWADLHPWDALAQSIRLATTLDIPFVSPHEGVASWNYALSSA